jgi:outer membrane protein OmpA-like peptidoglycan-associated protein
MTGAPRITVLLATFAATLVTACGPQRIVAGPSRPAQALPAQALIVLLADTNGSVGRARVSNESGSADLSSERGATHVAANQPPDPTSTLSEAEVKRIFGAALSALPPAPRHFTLYFQFESDELTDQSRVVVPEILKTVRERTVPDVTVVGHTDTAGTSKANFELGLKRATTVRNLLVKAGLDASSVEVTSHGKADLLIHTPDETPEPRNRRVEIAVR